MFRIVVHGGCGTLLSRNNVTSDREARCRVTLREATQAGCEVLNKGGTALEACVAAVKVFEDNDDFNAGRGSVLTRDGTVEMDAALMCGRLRACGGVSLLKNIKNPIDAARVVLEHTTEALIAGPGAEKIAKEHGLRAMPDEYFLVPLRVEQLKKQQQEAVAGNVMAELDHGGAAPNSTGTVGAVALDKRGNMAAASSTGGMSGKVPGRVADSSIAGCGLWADELCAVTGTGHGHYFTQTTACKHVADRFRYLNESIDAACNYVIDSDFQPIARPKDIAKPECTVSGTKPSAGFIALDKQGNISMPFNTPGMFRAYNEGDEIVVKVFNDE